MAQIFPKRFNALSKASIAVVVVLAGGIGYGAFTLTQTDYWTKVGVAPTQPIQFSHAHHVSGLGIDCRYCHTSVESASFAGIPPTKTCMNCHQQIWTGAPMLEPVRDSYKTDKSLEWTRVHRLADFAYFDHSIHVNNGIGCSTCHGRVDQMQAVYQKGSLLMNWCLECHRAPEKFVRPKDQIYNHGWDYTQAVKRDGKYFGTQAQADAEIANLIGALPADLSADTRKQKIEEIKGEFTHYGSQVELGKELVKQGPVGKPASEGYELRKILECSGCHR